jgi:acetyl/propionyl-CoA carboxylase alpha subunit
LVTIGIKQATSLGKRKSENWYKLIQNDKMALPDKLLVANRGEIAFRIVKSAKQLGIRTVAIYAEAEKESGYVSLADEAVSLGLEGLNSTFLNMERIIEIALSTGSTAIHPGYGFLSENADFARACEKNHIAFVGPDSSVLELMGDKPAAKKLAAKLGIPVLAGHSLEFSDITTLEPLEFPLLIKASHGGGGKGMQIVHNQAELSTAAQLSSRAALNYFGNGAIFVEKLLKEARHVEVQLLGDQHGQLVHLFERECSIQRNHQKIVEEAPALCLNPQLRADILAAALKIGGAVHYTGAGTVEFLVDQNGNYYFMEMNPRIQVEHAVTEEVTGIDIVAEQLKIAAGLPLSFTQEDIKLKGHAIEVRVYAEDPANGFIPSSAELAHICLPGHPDLRIEADINLKRPTGSQFDPLLLKLIARGSDRLQAVALLSETIQELNVIGPSTNVQYLERILCHPKYLQNNISVEFCTANHVELIEYQNKKADSLEQAYLFAMAVSLRYLVHIKQTNGNPWNYLGFWRVNTPYIPISIDGLSYHLGVNVNDKSNPWFLSDGILTTFQMKECSATCMEISIHQQDRKIYYQPDPSGRFRVSFGNKCHTIGFPGLAENLPTSIEAGKPVTNEEKAEIISPMHGKIMEILVKENQWIKKDDPLLVIEAMKTENKILSHKDAWVRKISVHVGTQVTDRMPLILLED